jgi:DNA polymerase type B, organellar and viral
MASTPESNDARAARNRRYREKNSEKVTKYEEYRRSSRNEYINGYRREKRLMRPFIGVDGEGRNLDNGYHAYFMLRAGEQVLWNRPFDQRLRTNDILEFLSSLDPDAEYVSYFFDYDVAKILEDLPWSKLDNLVHREKRRRDKGGYFPVDFSDYQIEYFPHKEFKVRKRDGPWITISDTGTFFQSAFITTLRLWDIGTDNEREKIAAGKDLRADFATVANEYIDEYNHIECRLLADLMTQFRDVCIELGYVPRKWQGPGQLAEVMLTKHGIPKTADLPIFGNTEQEGFDEAFREIVDREYGVGAFGRYAYYGGWFEVSMVGYTPKPCVQWDINSAYPAALLHVPCLVHGVWERVSGRRQLSSDELSISFGTFTHSTDDKRTMFGGFSVRRDNGSVHRPLNGKGWYWSFEARAAQHQDYTVYDSWVYHNHCECVPFSFVEPLYIKRKSLGKSARGYVLKLILNSLYGKMVQSIGNPSFANPIHGSFITAWVRTAMASAIHALPACRHPDPKVPCGSDVFMVATDAIVTHDYSGLDRFYDVGEGLGQFSKDVHSNGLFIIQPGVYFDPAGGSSDQTTYKTRGVPKRKIIEYRSEFLKRYEVMAVTSNVPAGDVHLPYSLFLGIKQSLVRRNTKLMGQFVAYVDPDTGEDGRRTSFEWRTKRQPEPLPPSAYLESGAPAQIWTVPYLGTENRLGKPCKSVLLTQTIPYSKDIGALVRNAARRLEFEGQPDWLLEQDHEPALME